MSKRNKLQITAEVQLKRGETRTYTGRFLGLLKDDEFNALVQEKEAMKKISTGPSMPLCPVFMRHDILTGMRFVMTAKYINGVATDGKMIFVSERLDRAGHTDPNVRQVRLTTVSQRDIYIEERDL